MQRSSERGLRPALTCGKGVIEPGKTLDKSLDREGEARGGERKQEDFSQFWEPSHTSTEMLAAKFKFFERLNLGVFLQTVMYRTPRRRCATNTGDHSSWGGM